MSFGASLSEGTSNWNSVRRSCLHRWPEDYWLLEWSDLWFQNYEGICIYIYTYICIGSLRTSFMRASLTLRTNNQLLNSSPLFFLHSTRLVYIGCSLVITLDVDLLQKLPAQLHVSERMGRVVLTTWVAMLLGLAVLLVQLRGDMPAAR